MTLALDFRALFAASSIPTLILAPDAPHFTIHEVNEAYLKTARRSDLITTVADVVAYGDLLPGSSLDLT